MKYIVDNPEILLLSGIVAMIFVFIKDKWVSNQEIVKKVDERWDSYWK